VKETHFWYYAAVLCVDIVKSLEIEIAYKPKKKACKTIATNTSFVA